MRAARVAGCSSIARWIQLRPLPSRNAVMMRIVNSANSEFTTPRPMSPSTFAASPMRAGSFSASVCSFSVML